MPKAPKPKPATEGTLLRIEALIQESSERLDLLAAAVGANTAAVVTLLTEILAAVPGSAGGVDLSVIENTLSDILARSDEHLACDKVAKAILESLTERVTGKT